MEAQSSTKERSDRISRLLSSQKSRAAYIKAKLAVLVPAQIRTLRLRSTNPPMPKQKDLARESEMYQSRISMFETPGTNITLETLSRIAAGLRCGLIVKFVRFSDMLHWENSFSPDTFNVTRLTEDEVFLDPAASHGEDAQMLVGSFPPPGNTLGSVVTFPGPSDGLKKSIENEQAGFSASAVGS